jgi:hypothetical protein
MSKTSRPTVTYGRPTKAASQSASREQQPNNARASGKTQPGEQKSFSAIENIFSGRASPRLIVSSNK